MWTYKIVVYILTVCIAASSLCIFIEAAPADRKQKTTDSKKSSPGTGEEISTTVSPVPTSTKSTAVISTTVSTGTPGGGSTTVPTDTLGGDSATASIDTGQEFTTQHSSLSTGNEGHLMGEEVTFEIPVTTTPEAVEPTTTDEGHFDMYGAFFG